MTLTPKAQRKLEYYMGQMFGRMITPKVYLKKVAILYREDEKKQKEFLIRQGFTKLSAFKHIYNLDKGVQVL